jgi:stage II sporulation protein D
MFVVPLMALWYNEPKPAAVQEHRPAIAIPGPPPEPGPEPEPFVEQPHIISDEYSAHGVLSFKILDSSTGRVSEVPVRDFVRGAVVAEMPATFHPEALKAQAVAAHTWALNNHLRQQRTPEPALKGADFAADPSNREGYMTERQARAFLGPQADMFWDKIVAAADSVLPFIIEHDGEPILAAYHAMSAGMTEDSGNVWLSSRPYLNPVESPGCLLAPNFEVEIVLSQARVKNTLHASHPRMDLSAPPGQWFNIVSRSDSGYVTEVAAGDLLLHGREIRTMFGLRSHNLDIGFGGSDFIFTARGYGHGVGLPQYGADFLARQGYTFDEILEYYYSDIVLRRVDFAALG